MWSGGSLTVCISTPGVTEVRQKVRKIKAELFINSHFLRTRQDFTFQNPVNITVKYQRFSACL